MTEPNSLPHRYAEIEGWLPWVDRMLFSRLLEDQDGRDTDIGPSTRVDGDLVELGAYLGKSAVVIGAHLRKGERFVVVDLFGAEDHLGMTDGDLANLRELRTSYSSLTRERFESNYRAVRGSLPVVIQGLSSVVVDHVARDGARFIHIDASHHFGQVLLDVENARALLGTDGIVVFDDFRSPHTPGVAAAVWESVLHGGLIPFAITRQKLYGTYGDADRYRRAVTAFVAHDRRFTIQQTQVDDHSILRVNVRTKRRVANPPLAVTNVPTAPPAKESMTTPPAAADRRAIAVRVADELLPPVVARWARRLVRRRRRSGP